MKLTDYYLMQVIKPLKSHRFDCVASTGGYEPFEAIADKSRDKRFFCYFGNVPDSFSGDARRRADKAITNGDSISSVLIPDLENPMLGYGDAKGTDDALLFLFADNYNQMEIFVARGMKNNQMNLFNLLSDGELDSEMEYLRTVAKSITDKIA